MNWFLKAVAAVVLIALLVFGMGSCIVQTNETKQRADEARLKELLKYKDENDKKVKILHVTIQHNGYFSCIIEGTKTKERKMIYFHNAGKLPLVNEVWVIEINKYGRYYLESKVE